MDLELFESSAESSIKMAESSYSNISAALSSDGK